MSGEVEIVEFVDNGQPREKKESPDEEDILNNILLFFGKSSKEVAEYIEEENISPSFITPNRRIDLHPAYEYMLRVPRVIGDIVRLKKILNDDTDELENFW